MLRANRTGNTAKIAVGDFKKKDRKEKLLYAIKRQFPDIDLRFYDIANNQSEFVDSSTTPNYDYFIEEPPFIVPSPWHFVSRSELSQGVLLLKDPSDAWRIRFWKEVFKNQAVSWLHLTRSAQESVNGLCDGWKFPYGYITTRSPKPLNVRGYTNSLMPWTEWYANFSTSNAVWRLLLGTNPVDLEKVVATQWTDAHATIIKEVETDPNYYKIVSPEDSNKIGFEWFRSEPIAAVSEICNKLGIELTHSLIKAARNMRGNRIQVTPGTDANSERWRTADNYELIRTYTTTPEILELSRQLGYNALGG